jgi:hypothetical protein
MEELNFADYVATCHTKKCINEDIPITIASDANSPLIVCGPCGQYISDIVSAVAK